MPKVEGGGTVYTGGPGTALRAPLYAKIAPAPGQPAGSYTYQPIVSASGNIQQPLIETFYQPGATVPATGKVLIARYAMQLVAVSFEFSHIGGTGAAVTLYKDPSGTAPGAGTALLQAAIDLTGGTVAVNTDYPGVLVATPASLQFAVTDGLSLVFSGTLTALTGLVCTCAFLQIP